MLLDCIRIILRQRPRGLIILSVCAVLFIAFLTFDSNLISLFIGNQQFLMRFSLLGYCILPGLITYFYSLELQQHFPRFSYARDLACLYILSALCYVTFSTQPNIILLKLNVLVTVIAIVVIIICLVKLHKQGTIRSIFFDIVALVSLIVYLFTILVDSALGILFSGIKFLLILAIFSSWLAQHIQILLLIYKQHTQRHTDELKEKVKVAEAAKHEAVLANKAKDTFLANMSHEIRTPINAILGLNEIILRESKSNSIKSYALNIASSGHMLLSIINDILDFSKITSGKMEIIPTDYCVSSLLNDLINMAKARIKDKPIELVTDIDPNLPAKLHGDDVRIRQVITNILTNAIKYTEKGTVKLVITSAVTGELADIHVSVQDTGIGIKEEDLPKLTQAYQRIEESRNRNIEGTGLGMTITTQLLHMMNSQLEVQSTYGKGSLFSFSIKQGVIDPNPIGDFQQRLEQASVDYSYAETFHAPNAHILVVDDNAINRQVFKNLLLSTQINIDEAVDGEDAVNKVKEVNYDIIYMDHMMPNVDGVEALHRIREFNTTTPIFALTANAVTGAKEFYMKEGFSGFLTKPIDSKKLEDITRSTLPEDLVTIDFEPSTDDGAEESEKLDVSTLPVVDGLDWNVAALHLPDLQLLKDTLTTFYKSIQSNADKLNEYYHQCLDLHEPNTELYDQYRILVHSMKSTASMLGISAYGIARLLEYAARDYNYITLLTLHDIFINEWLSYKDRLKGVFGLGEEEAPDPSKPVLDEETLEYLLKSLKTALEDFDTDTADNIAKVFESYDQKELHPTIQAAIESILDYAQNLDTDKAIEEITVVQNVMEFKN